MSEIAKHWIDGEWTGSGTISESVNLASGAVLGQWADRGEAEARAAIAAARRAFDTSPWSRDRSLRHRALNEMAEGFDARAEELGTLVTKENGKKIAEGMLEGTSRILVQRGVAGEVRTRLADIFENVRLGDGLDPGTDMGPLIDKADVARVDGVVQAALAYAKPIVRGGPATDGALAAGAFYRPALLEVQDVNTDIVQKEVFGPVATFEVFDTETDAIVRANATEYGLAAGIFTSNINISRRVSREIHAGTIWTNTWAAINDGFAEGGYKQSGIGRLRGPLAITEFEEAKTGVHAIQPFQA
jgi:acyl-CoA reductase-like NAD-dependent aldehyde dehydrogenase